MKKTFIKVGEYNMPKHQKISTMQLRKKNKNNVYRLFYDSCKPKTKQDVAFELNLSLPTVTQNLNELLDANLIKYSGYIDSNGGRRARTMSIVPNSRISIGMELSPKHIKIVATDLYGNEIAYKNVDSIFSMDISYKKLIAFVLESFLDEFSLSRDKLLGVGITLPAIINEKTGIIENSPVLSLKQVDVKTLTEYIIYPVYVVNDANAGGYAEMFNQKKQDAMAYVFIGKGVGGAIIIDSKAYNGQNLRSAEFGHICIHPNGEKCLCGKNGCLEAYCSVARLSDDLNITIEEFFDELSKKNAEYIKIFDKYLDDLALGLHTIRMVMDCDIVLGGTITAHLPEYMQKLKHKLSELDSFGSNGDYLRLGTCGAKANCIGAALHFVSDFMNSI